MGYKRVDWEKRLKYRSDMTSYLTHLTRPAYNSDGSISMTSVDVLLKILNERMLTGSNTSTGFIQGSDRAVCFQDTPLYGVMQNILHEEMYRDELGGKLRYEGTGLAFFKPYVFNTGNARPVIYEKKEEAKIKFPNELWRVVTYDLSDRHNIIDWTHEREWRIKGDFEFPLNIVTVLLANRSDYSEFIEKVDRDILLKLSGIVVLQNILE